MDFCLFHNSKNKLKFDSNKSNTNLERDNFNQAKKRK